MCGLAEAMSNTNFSVFAFLSGLMTKFWFMNVPGIESLVTMSVFSVPGVMWSFMGCIFSKWHVVVILGAWAMWSLMGDHTEMQFHT